MPHIIVEYSESLKNIDVPKLVIKLHDILAEQPTVNIHAIKSRAIPVENAVIGDGNEPDFMVHITLKLLPGRDDALKKKMAQSLFDTAKTHIKIERLSLSVEVMELHAESYTK
ncbi:MAG: 5-carboxymethyl-2-hydroxymuconate Delta-isomerase [Micavibrio sp.]|nr:5-carboxymethyl-2-hydroxymuconate Delta-isomerase [Micavibrio sp.]